MGETSPHRERQKEALRDSENWPLLKKEIKKMRDEEVSNFMALTFIAASASALIAMGNSCLNFVHHALKDTNM